MLRILRVASALVLASTCVASADAGILGWYTTLSSTKAVPPTQSSFSGIGYFGKTGNVLTCNVYCTVNFGTARIHVGAPGTNGPEIGILKQDAVGHWLSKLTLDAATLAQLEAGNLYAEVTGLMVPDKFRGQLTMTYALDGTGCPDSVSTPWVSGIGTPTPGVSIYVNCGGAPANGFGVLFASLAPLNTPINGCTLLVDPNVAFLIPLNFSAGGGWSTGSFIVPPLPVAQMPLYLQLFAADPAAPNGEFGASARLTINFSTYPL